MELNTTNTSTGTAAWAGSGMCISPKQSQHGSGLPFAGYATDLAVVPTAVRTADAAVPDPRGRQR